MPRLAGGPGGLVAQRRGRGDVDDVGLEPEHHCAQSTSRLEPDPEVLVEREARAAGDGHREPGVGRRTGRCEHLRDVALGREVLQHAAYGVGDAVDLRQERLGHDQHAQPIGIGAPRLELDQVGPGEGRVGDGGLAVSTAQLRRCQGHDRTMAARSQQRGWPGQTTREHQLTGATQPQRAVRRLRRSRARECHGPWWRCPWPRGGGRTRARPSGRLAVHFEPGVGLSGIRLTCTQPQSP